MLACHAAPPLLTAGSAHTQMRSAHHHLLSPSRPAACNPLASGRRRYNTHVHNASAGDAQPPSSSSNQQQPEETNAQPEVWSRVKKAVLGDKELDRARLAELGFGAFAAYGVISNLNACVLGTLAWLTLVKTTGATPLMPGMWPKFLAVYGGLWLGAGFMRPIRLSMAIAAAPSFDRMLSSIMTRTGCNKIVAFGILLFGIALGSFALLGFSLLVLGGLPGGK